MPSAPPHPRVSAGDATETAIPRRVYHAIDDATGKMLGMTNPFITPAKARADRRGRRSAWPGRDEA